MCGRYNIITDAQALIDAYEIAHTLFDPDDWQPRYNVAPSQDVPIVRETNHGRELALARWGLVPRWTRNPSRSIPPSTPGRRPSPRSPPTGRRSSGSGA